jgi:hypothetical protein
MFLLGSFWAHASRPSMQDLNNQSYVSLLNQYFSLQVKVVPNSDAASANQELQQLLDDQYQVKKHGESSLPNGSLKHLTCTAAPCGGCSRGPC